MRVLVLLCIGLLIYAGSASAAETLPAITVTAGQGGSQTYSVTIQILALMTALTFIPAALMMMTSFTRIIIVLCLYFLRFSLWRRYSNE